MSVDMGTKHLCNICGGTEFISGYNGRVVGQHKLPPTCSNCNSAERHRIIWGIYTQLLSIVSKFQVLHYAPDCSVKSDWFQLYDGSRYGGPNSLDMMNTGLPDASYDLVISNHVLEHVSNDIAAIRESIRIVGKRGLVHVCVPSPCTQMQTEDWGYPDPNRIDHYRMYGADVGHLICKQIQGLNCLAIVGRDSVTGGNEILFFFSMRPDQLLQIGKPLQRAGIPIIWLVLSN